jgi:hypothetical protein
MDRIAREDMAWIARNQPAPHRDDDPGYQARLRARVITACGILGLSTEETAAELLRAEAEGLEAVACELGDRVIARRAP